MKSVQAQSSHRTQAAPVPRGPETREIGRALVALSTDLDLPDGFLRNLLLEQSDWAFIVKAQAILETAVTSLLVAHLGKPESRRLRRRDMEMSQRIKMLGALKRAARRSGR